MIGGNEYILASTPIVQSQLPSQTKITFSPTSSEVKVKFKYGTSAWTWHGHSICITKPVMISETYYVDVCDGGEDKYRFGFNGMEKDNEVKGIGNSLDFGARMYDSRVGRWMSEDPFFRNYPSVSSYNFALNTPIQARDPDGNVVIFINGQHTGDGGKTDYWRKKEKRYGGGLHYTTDYRSFTFTFPYSYYVEVKAVDKLFMNAFGDYAARYYDGALGGWNNTLWSTNNVNLSYKNRKNSGKLMGYTHAQEIYNNLEKGETIKIVTHSMGTAYSRGFVDGMNQWASENKVSFTFEYQVDLAAFDGEDLPVHKSVGRSFFKSGDKDWLANTKESKGFGKSSDIPGGEELPTKKGTGHSVYEYDAEDVPKSKNNNSAKPGSAPVYEQNR